MTQPTKDCISLQVTARDARRATGSGAPTAQRKQRDGMVGGAISLALRFGRLS